MKFYGQAQEDEYLYNTYFKTKKWKIYRIRGDGWNSIF